jgi:hypothetical protein
MMGLPRLAAPHLALTAAVVTAPPPVSVAAPTLQVIPGSGGLFFVAELEVYRAGSPPVGDRGHFSRAHFTPLPAATRLESTETVRASDLGYRSRATDAGGVQVYPSLLQKAFEIDRYLPLSPLSPANAAGWGALSLSNAGRRFDALAANHNADARPVRVLAGRKRPDATRGYDADPPRAELVEVFTGLGQPWTLSEATLSVPLRDATYWLERGFQEAVYGGTGGYDGAAALKGRLKPRARGGSHALPIRDCPPVWVDQVNLVAQLSDAPGVVQVASENGDQAQILPEPGGAQVADLYVGTTSPGHYRWCSRPDGLYVQLGSRPVGTISFDVVGHFPSGTPAATAAEIARLLLIEDLRLPPSLLRAEDFAALNAARPWVAGDHWDGSAGVDPKVAVGIFIDSLGAKLFPARDGRLRTMLLAPLPAGTTPLASYDEEEILDLQRSDRLAQGGLYPPPYRWRVAWARCGTVLASGVDEDVSAERRAFLADEYRTAGWSSGAIQRAYRRPNDLEPVTTRLLDGANADALVAGFGALWSGDRAPALYEMELPMHLALRHDIGHPVRIAYPMDDLDSGRLGQVVGEAIRNGDGTATLAVLVS